MNNKYLRCAFAVMIGLIAIAPSAAAQGKEITVSAAISLKNAFEEIGTQFTVKHGTKVVFNFGGSGDLMTQIIAGAPVDVYASAAQKDMDELSKHGDTDTSTTALFAANSIVLIVPIGAATPMTSFQGLTAAAIQKIAIGNPKTVPAGRYAEEVFAYYRLLPAIKDKLIPTENVRQALDYVARGEVDAGVVYATDAAARSKETRIVAVAPEASHKQVVYPITVVKNTQNAQIAKAFIAFVLSNDGGAILHKYGFKSAKPGSR